jgi:hypothetical protein
MDLLQIIAINVTEGYEMCNSARISLSSPDEAEINTRVFERILHDDKWTPIRSELSRQFFRAPGADSVASAVRGLACFAGAFRFSSL